MNDSTLGQNETHDNSILSRFQWPLPGRPFFLSGSLQNMNDFLAMQNVLAIGGSWLATRKLIADADYGSITENVKTAIDIQNYD